MRTLLIRVDSHLSVRRADLKAAGLSPKDLRDAFTYDNPDFWKQERLGFYTGGTERTISLVESDADELRLPRGVLDRVREILAADRVEPAFDDRTVSGTQFMLSDVRALDWTAPFRLHPDQRSAAKACVRRRSGIVVGQCASGKTEIAFKAISEIGERAIVVVHTERILRSWVEKARERFPRARIGAFFGKKKEPDSDVVVGMIQSVLNKIKSDPGWTRCFGTFVLDEAHHCFPAGTPVDGRAIESLRRGDLIQAFDTESLERTVRRVVENLARPVTALVEVEVAGERLPVTPDHPYFTRRGWVDAGDLRVGDMLLSFMHHEEVVEDDAADEPRPLGGILPSDEGSKPDVRSGDAGAGLDDAPLEGLASSGPRGERDGADGAAAPPRMRPRLGDGGSDPNGVCTWGVEVPDVLQGRRREPDPQDRDRDRRELTSSDRTAASRPKARRVPRWLRVDDVTVLEPGRDGTFGGRAPDGRVYNLRVEGEETFLVGDLGIAVHNCPANTFSAVVSAFGARHRLAFTATPRRKDAKEVLLYDAFGAEVVRSKRTGKRTSGPRVLFRITDEMLDRFGRIMPIEVVVVPTEFEFDLNRADELDALGFDLERRESGIAAVKRWATETGFCGPLNTYSEMLDEMVRDKRRQARILAYLLPEIAAGNPSLLLADRREFCLELRNWLRRRKIEAGTLMGGKNRKDADRTEDALNAGKLLVAVGTSIADEGMDCKVISRGFGCTPVGSNVGRLTQQFGRFKRLSPESGKVDAVYYYFWDRRVRGLRRHLRAVANAVKPPHSIWWSEEPGARVPMTKRLIADLERC